MKLYKNTIVYCVSAIVILLIVFGPTSWFDYMIENDINGFNKDIEAIERSITEDNFENKLDNCEALEKNWNKHMRHWSFFIHHSQIEAINISVKTYLLYIREGNTSAASAEHERMKQMFDMVKKLDKLYLQNIF